MGGFSDVVRIQFLPADRCSSGLSAVSYHLLNLMSQNFLGKSFMATANAIPNRSSVSMLMGRLATQATGT